MKSKMANRTRFCAAAKAVTFCAATVAILSSVIVGYFYWPSMIFFPNIAIVLEALLCRLVFGNYIEEFGGVRFATQAFPFLLFATASLIFCLLSSYFGHAGTRVAPNGDISAVLFDIKWDDLNADGHLDAVLVENGFGFVCSFACIFCFIFIRDAWNRIFKMCLASCLQPSYTVGASGASSKPTAAD